ncbi:RDD family protein [Streptomyces sp. J2-1]|uniref:RDD family protein n=1 Tax=Streptomyces corallincola TaxID=2851888 RepID=UPI001C3839F1|nr:RDD family protein [Streptomyces corallincola]MBV2354388.1 RDD family protein [Streptomyces corallincola]
MSAPTPDPGDDRPREGYYPDPSIPGYVRYWNGASWVPGTSRPAPADGAPLVPPGGTRPAPVSPAPVEETGPHFFDEDPQPGAPGPGRLGASAPGGPVRGAPWGADPRVPGGDSGPSGGDAGGDTAGPPDPGTFVFRRPVPGPAAGADRGAPGFGPAPDGFPAQGPVVAPGADGRGAGSAGGSPGFGAGKAAAARAAAGQPAQAPAQAPPQGAQAPRAQQSGYAFPPVASAATAPPFPAQAQQPAGAGTPLTAGPGGGQASWAQQVHQLAGGADEQPVAPWKPPVEDVFQAAARRRAAVRPAGLGKRFAARLIDSVVVGAVTAAVAVPLGTGALDHVRQKIDEARLSGREVTVWLLDGTTGTALALVLGTLLVSGVLYEVLPTVKWGRTLGKKLCGLEVRDIEAHEPPMFGAALRRWLVYSVPGLLGIGIVGVLWGAFDRPWRQCWHDKAAHTFVAD